jgi:hypothetical protein
VTISLGLIYTMAWSSTTVSWHCPLRKSSPLSVPFTDTQLNTELLRYIYGIYSIFNISTVICDKIGKLFQRPHFKVTKPLTSSISDGIYWRGTELGQSLQCKPYPPTKSRQRLCTFCTLRPNSATSVTYSGRYCYSSPSTSMKLQPQGFKPSLSVQSPVQSSSGVYKLD